MSSALDFKFRKTVYEYRGWLIELRRDDNGRWEFETSVPDSVEPITVIGRDLGGKKKVQAEAKRLVDLYLAEPRGEETEIIVHAPRSKVEFYRRYPQGEFGNRPQNWANWDALRESGYDGLVSARHSGDRIKPMILEQTVEQLLASGRTDLNEYAFIESPPHHKNKMHGETILCPRIPGKVGPSLRFGRSVGTTQRDGMAEANGAKNVFGAEALAVLKWGMCPSSYEDWLALSERFPTAAIEFTCFRIPFGIIPHRNTVIWEVREDYDYDYAVRRSAGSSLELLVPLHS